MKKFDKDLYTELSRARRYVPGGVPRGRFWYSRKQRQLLDKMGRDRFYFKRKDGQILEYTEMIEERDLAEYPALCPVDFPDAVLVGDGVYFGRVAI
ncbi:MAG TPA: hypothetical protein PLR20_15215 [Syntrophales bacterium]|jgi:hypothetical protein|nr:hypothetical protein [Syntrophales bacterium]